MVTSHSVPVTDLNAAKEFLFEGRGEEESLVISRACEMAFRSGLPQVAASESPSLSRCVSIAAILADLRLDHETIAAAILRDLVEDRRGSPEELKAVFGSSVTGLVEGLTRLDLIQTAPTESEKGKKDRPQVEILRKMLLAMSDDLRAVLIKLAERLYYMRNAKTLAEVRRRMLAKESLDVFAPLANRLGIGRIRWELEDLSFQCLDADTYKRIARLLDERRVDRERNIAAAVKRLKAELERAAIDGEVSGRAKHIYSIWRKMTRKGVDFDRIFDVSAVRVLVGDVAACYAAVGVVHTLWEPIRGEFDDYIATPKENGYKALHTAVIGPDGKNLEVQIRTFDMHREAELGVAAHWSYKEGAGQGVEFQKKIAWLRQVLEVKDPAGLDFMSRFKSEMFQDRVYVLTPKGEVFDLPKGATPLDFAYHIHSEVGHRCRGAKIEGKIVPLVHTLKSGERVEILTGKQPAPSREWLNPHLGYLRTSRARSKVKQWFRLQDYDRNVAAGRTILERELQRLGVVGANLEKLAQRFGKNRLDDFLEALGRGEITPTQLSAAFSEAPGTHSPHSTEVLEGGTVPSRSEDATGGIRILGVGNLLTSAARCCRPLPEDAIAGYVTRGRGVSIHRQDCANFQRMKLESPERVVRVDWSAREKDLFTAHIRVRSRTRPTVMRDVSAVLAEEKVNVISAKTVLEASSGLASLSFLVEVANLGQLTRALAAISQVSGVLEASRAPS